MTFLEVIRKLFKGGAGFLIAVVSIAFVLTVVALFLLPERLHVLVLLVLIPALVLVINRRTGR
ncbi:hypothetical protein [Streptomyces dysideae]|uniref:Uncharacterized protein n=1 Tax=Streptomyces dysideae TaxID=909626 RepID=A0A117S235_9ACTN|nr:hypothetical protein [Streptomyces dysideae]KUO22337.1 hypothetical protein AQJ91_05045 [Streptomyces dysideae]